MAFEDVLSLTSQAGRLWHSSSHLRDLAFPRRAVILLSPRPCNVLIVVVAEVIRRDISLALVLQLVNDLKLSARIHFER